MPKIYVLSGYLGRVESRHSRLTGTTVSIYNAEQAMMDTAGGPWALVCEDHGTICNVRSLREAYAHLPCVDWCEQCQELIIQRAQHNLAKGVQRA